MVNGITLVGAYLVTKAVGVIVEETVEELFSWDKFTPESTIRIKIRALYDRCLNHEWRIVIRLFWKNLPLGICAFLIDQDDILFNLGRLSIVAIMMTDPTAWSNQNLDSFFSESSCILNISKIITFTCIIFAARAGGGCFCNYLRPRVPPPFNNILRRLQNEIDVR